jgi:hypothetical protein
MVAVAIVTKMIERGWQASAGPGQYTVLRLGERSWEPFRITNAFADGERTVEEWLELCSELGIADLDLGPAEPAEAQEPSPGPSPSSGPSPSPPEIGADTSAPKSPRKRIWKLVSLVGVGLVVVVLIEITDRLRMSDSVFDNSDRSAIRDRTPSSSRSDGQPPFSLSIRGPDLVATVTDWSSGSRSYGATVDVLNRGPKAYNFIMVRVEFCDAAGRVVGTLLTDARSNDSILPGSVRTFKVSGNGSLHFATARASVVYSAEME